MGMEHSRFGHDIKKRIADKLPQNVSKKWEDRIRSNTIEKHGYTPLNEMLSYGIDPKYPEDIGIHVHENLTRTSIQANTQMLSGLKILAEKMQTDPALAPMKRVAAYSWIVYNSPDILRMLGFELGERDEAKKVALATMGRDAFIRKFRSNKSEEKV